MLSCWLTTQFLHLTTKVEFLTQINCKVESKLRTYFTCLCNIFRGINEYIISNILYELNGRVRSWTSNTFHCTYIIIFIDNTPHETRECSKNERNPLRSRFYAPSHLTNAINIIHNEQPSWAVGQHESQFPLLDTTSASCVDLSVDIVLLILLNALLRVFSSSPPRPSSGPHSECGSSNMENEIPIIPKQFFFRMYGVQCHHTIDNNPMRIWFWYSNFVYPLASSHCWCAELYRDVISIVIIFLIEFSSFFSSYYSRLEIFFFVRNENVNRELDIDYVLGFRVLFCFSCFWCRKNQQHCKQEENFSSHNKWFFVEISIQVSLEMLGAK